MAHQLKKYHDSLCLGADYETTTFGTAAMMLEQDSVEVIRCKDCKHRNRYYCYHPEQMYLAVDIDYYCARGERRDP